MENKTVRIVPAADKTLHLLEHMATAGKEDFGITELSTALAYSKGTIHSILQTLIANHWAEQNTSSGRYNLTNKFVLLADRAQQTDRLISDFMLVGSSMERQCGELINLHYLKELSSATLVASVPTSQHSLRVDFPLGSTIPVIASSAGKCLVCELNDSYLSQIFSTCSKHFTSATIRSEADFFKEIHATRCNGYAVNHAEYEDGVYSVAAPIRNQSGHIIAAINIVIPQPRFTPDRYQSLIELTRAGARKLSELHGYLPSGH